MIFDIEVKFLSVTHTYTYEYIYSCLNMFCCLKVGNDNLQGRKGDNTDQVGARFAALFRFLLVYNYS